MDWDGTMTTVCSPCSSGLRPLIDSHNGISFSWSFSNCISAPLSEMPSGGNSSGFIIAMSGLSIVLDR
jgi:hypothetical protein